MRGARLLVQLGVETLQVLVGVESGHAAGARGRDGLSVDMIGNIPGREHTGQAGRGGVAFAPPSTRM